MATLKDVARESGLTVGTVSRVLNNRGYISDKAREKVDRAMKKLNYRPNEVARSLSRSTSSTIGVIVPHIRHPYFAEMISSLEYQAYQKGYKILLCNSGNTAEKEREYIEMCTGNKVAGIILCSGTAPAGDFGQTGTPVVTIERFLDNGTAAVECDNRQGGILAAEKLISCGCRQMLYIGNPGGVFVSAGMRREGFREVCEREHVPFQEQLTEEIPYDSMLYEDMLEEALRKFPETDGMFVNSDIIAAQTLQVCRKLHIDVPKRVKIIGFGDVFLSALTTPRLTTIHQPVREMAEIALNLLRDSVSGRLVAKRTILPVSLVERETA